MKRLFRKIAFYSILLAIFITGIIMWCNYHINSFSSSYIYKDANALPQVPVAMVLGTVSKVNGSPNAYFTHRISAAAELFKQGKVKHFVVSGDNHVKGYDEPEDMRLALIQAGVPDSCITLDYAGFRTLDSVIRGLKVFGQKKYIIISQEFHNERAVFLARKSGIEAIGFNARDVSKYYGLRTNAREYLARVKACLDIYVTRADPKFLGEPIHLPL